MIAVGSLCELERGRGLLHSSHTIWAKIPFGISGAKQSKPTIPHRMTLLIIADDETLLNKLPDAHAEVLISRGDLPAPLFSALALLAHTPMGFHTVTGAC